MCYSVPKILAHVSTEHVYVCVRETESVRVCVFERRQRVCERERATRYPRFSSISVLYTCMCLRGSVCERERERECVYVRERESINKCASTLTLSHTNPGTRGSCKFHY